ncbi:hypothetical protein ACAG96_01215 [Candidatus Izemoplasma sp. B36]|uniref:hypothetical protein n=1 Tax=Candidatus Izemoplasma sp. B36 TaxID=3242468 RepID=UPI0035571E71
MSKFKTSEEYFAFSKRLVVIPTEDIKKLLLKHKINLPLYVHAFLLKETIRQNVFEPRLYETYSDELKFRLRGYDEYSVFPLEKLIEKYNLDFEVSRYKELLFDFIFVNRDDLRFKNSFINDLEQLQHNYTVDLEVMKYSDFYALLEEVFYEAEGYLDGVILEDWTEDFLASYTLGDLKALGKKYNVTVPRRINKSKLIAILSAKFKLTEDESLLLTKKSVLDLEIYAKEKGFQISIDLKKKDMIEFMKFSLDMYHKKSHVDKYNYDIPLATKEETAISDIEEPEEEVIKEEPVVEEEPVIIPVPVEEEVEEQPVVEEEPQPQIEEEPEEQPMEEPEEEDIEVPEELEEEDLEEEVVEEEPVPEPEIIKEPVMKEKPKPTVDESLLSVEEKELLDEKINQIIKKYYKKRRRRRITWIILITLIVLIVGFAGYSYYYYTSVNPGNLPFGLPVFWN